MLFTFVVKLVSAVRERGLGSGGKFLLLNHGYVKGLIVVARSIEMY